MGNIYRVIIRHLYYCNDSVGDSADKKETEKNYCGHGCVGNNSCCRSNYGT